MKNLSQEVLVSTPVKFCWMSNIVPYTQYEQPSWHEFFDDPSGRLSLHLEWKNHSHERLPLLRTAAVTKRCAWRLCRIFKYLDSEKRSGINDFTQRKNIWLSWWGFPWVRRVTLCNYGYTCCIMVVRSSKLKPRLSNHWKPRESSSNDDELKHINLQSVGQFLSKLEESKNQFIGRSLVVKCRVRSSI